MSNGSKKERIIFSDVNWPSITRYIINWVSRPYYLPDTIYNTSYPVSLIPPDKNEGPIPRLLSSRTYFLQNNSLALLMIKKEKIVS